MRCWVNQPKKGFLRYREPIETVAHLRASSLDLDQDSVRIGRQADLKKEEHAQVLHLLKNFMPWRKGPFSIFDINVDAEWQSWRKWNRLLPEPETTSLMLRKGEIDISSSLPNELIEYLRKQEGLKVDSQVILNHYSFAFNVSLPPVDNVKVRQALA